MALSVLSEDPWGHQDHSTGDGYWLAPGGIPSLVALEIA
jgi:hypothetical protein